MGLARFLCATQRIFSNLINTQMTLYVTIIDTISNDFNHIVVPFKYFHTHTQPNHTHPYPSIPNHTHPYPSIHIHTHPYPSIPIYIHLYPSIPIYTHLYPSILPITVLPITVLPITVLPIALLGIEPSHR